MPINRPAGWMVKESAVNDSALPDALTEIADAILRKDGGEVLVCTPNELLDSASDIVRWLNEEGRLRPLLGALKIAVPAGHNQPELTPDEFRGVSSKATGLLVRHMLEKRSTKMTEAA